VDPDVDRRSKGSLEKIEHAVHERLDVHRDGLRVLPSRECEHPLRQGSSSHRGLHCVLQQLDGLGIAPARLRTSSRLLTMTISRLLKSCATPPVSWPMASSFWDWNSVSPRALECLLGFAALADVARDLGEPDQLAGAVADRIDDDIGPEMAAILADPPAFALVASVAQRGLQGA
jgi:hypothetical protein